LVVLFEEDSMHGNISYQFTSGTGSEADDDGKISGQWLVFAVITLLTTALVLCAAGAAMDPGLLSLEPTFVGP
jgi:hypothetical protein